MLTLVLSSVECCMKRDGVKRLIEVQCVCDESNATIIEDLLTLTTTSCFMAATLHVHISQEVSIYLSLCLLGTTLVGV